jgi:hypothetical protein
MPQWRMRRAHLHCFLLPEGAKPDNCSGGITACEFGMEKPPPMSIARLSWTRDRCVMYAEFSGNIAGRLRSCVVARWGAPLLRENVQTGTAVQLQIEENAIGRVLVSITPSDGAPTE